MRPQRGIDFMNKEYAEDLLRKVLSVLGECGVSYWADFGTLLGAVCEGDFIDTDFDIDISYIAIDDWKVIFDRLRLECDLDFVHDFLRVGGRTFLRKSNIVVTGKKGFAKLELVPSYFYGPDDSYYKLTGSKDDCVLGAGVPAKYLKNFGVVPIRGTLIRIPNSDVEGLLEYHYGEWRVPDSKSISSTYIRPFTKLDPKLL